MEYKAKIKRIGSMIEEDYLIDFLFLEKKDGSIVKLTGDEKLIVFTKEAQK